MILQKEKYYRLIGQFRTKIRLHVISLIGLILKILGGWPISEENKCVNPLPHNTAF